MTLRGLLPICTICKFVVFLVYIRTRGNNRKFMRLRAHFCRRCSLVWNIDEQPLPVGLIEIVDNH